MSANFKLQLAARAQATLLVRGVEVQVRRKRIKNLYIRVQPPDGQVRVSAPLAATDAQVREVVGKRLDWIRQHQQRLRQRSPVPSLAVVSGELHPVEGRACRLRVLERAGRPKAWLHDGELLLGAAKDSTPEQRLEALRRFYRGLLVERIAPLAAHWEPRLGVRAEQWRIRRMKSRWGSCNIVARRVWLNLELAKKPPQCLEYVLVHELNHLLERLHNPRFYALMDRHLPDWRQRRELLNSRS